MFYTSPQIKSLTTKQRNIGTILPPMIIISIISLFYEQFRSNQYIAVALEVMRAGVAAVIFDVVINLITNVCKTRRILYIIMMIVAFVCTYFLGVSAMIIIFVCLAIGLMDLILTQLFLHQGNDYKSTTKSTCT